MNALLLYVAFPGFACIPSDIMSSAPYAGPFIMPIERARQIKDDYHGPLWLQLVRGDDPRFADIKSRCPPIYF